MIILAFYMFLCIKSAYMVVGETNLDEYNLKNSLDLELKPMFVVNHGSQPTEENLEIKEFYDTYNSLCGSAAKKYNSLLRTVHNYMLRYVNTFLIISGISDQVEKDSNEMITVDLEITISPEDLAYLQEFSKISQESSVLRDFSRLDAILSKVAKKKERSHLDRALRFSISLLYYICLACHRLLVLSNYYNFTPFLMILLVTYLIYRFSSVKSTFFYLGIILNSLIFWESLQMYRIKIKEAEIEWERLKLMEMPEECNPANSRWYHSVINIFSGDRCLEFLKKVNTNPLDKVSLFKCIVDTYSLYMIQTVFKVFGASIRDFTGEVSALWPAPLRWIISIPLVPFLIVLGALLILILCGKRLKLSFFGAAVEIGDSTVTETKIINHTGPRLISSYRPLRILSKSRLFKRSERESAREKNSSVKNSKSESAVEHETSDDTDFAQPSAADESAIAKKLN